MRAWLKFELPEEEELFEITSHAVDWFSVVHAMDEALRSWIRYGYEFKSVDEALKEIRQRLWGEVNTRGLTLG